MSKLSSNEVTAIKNLYKKGVSISALSNAFNVSYDTIKYHTVPGYKAVKRIRGIVRTTPDDKLVEVLSNYMDRIRG